MPYLKYVRAGKEKNRIELGIAVDNDVVKSYSVSTVFYSHVGEPLRGEEIDGGLVSAIIAEDEQYRAMKKALSLLAYSDKSRSALYMRLTGLGYSKTSASDAVKECMRLGYINEREQIARFVKREANQSLKGRLHIIKKALTRGFKADEVREVIDSLSESGEIDFEANFEALAQKKGAESDEERAALRYKNGYTGRY